MQTTKEIIRQVKKIEIVTRQPVDGLIAGNYHSVFKGQGLEFSELREYVPGDDIRVIDWKVTARFNHPFVREFIEERDLRAYILFDASGSTSFGNTVAKRRKAVELAATLMFSAIRNNDNIGLFIFTDTVERFVPARKGRRHALKLLSILLSHEPQSMKTDLATSLSTIAKLLKKRSILFIVSDFIGDNCAQQLSLLKNRHDVIALRVRDEREEHLPNVGLIRLEDAETGEQLLIDTSDESFRRQYAVLVKQHAQRFQKQLRKLHVDLVDIKTGEPYEAPLRRFFRLRARRVV
ncbi:DUF58 domain-containing protein [Candidatus Woesearchaeota archaeon]|nr:MAG: DUF58 domain-containing protein [Candidatus Woesearchaeota archaeon]